MLDSLELGYTAEVLHLGRALHEANRLLNVFHMVNEDDLVRRWLAGEYVSPGNCRQAEERFDVFLAEAMKARGEEPMPTIRGEKSREVYGHLSEAAHHRRRWAEDVVFAQERIMFTRSHRRLSPESGDCGLSLARGGRGGYWRRRRSRPSCPSADLVRRMRPASAR